MKKYYSLLLCLFPLLGYAQPVMTYETHGLKPGTDNIMRPIEYIAPGDAGTQIIWDFKHAIPAANTTLVKENLSQLDSRNVVVTNQQGGKFSYICDRQANTYNGYYDGNLSLIFDQPIKKVIYPFTYGDKISGFFSGHILYADNTMEYSRTGSYSSEADALGTVVMPGGQVLKNVLRLKTVEKYVEQACSSIDVEYIKYLWYIEEYRYPVVVIQDVTYKYPDGKTVSQRQSFVTTADIQQASADTPVYESEPTVAINNEQPDNIEHSVYPNPYSDVLHITYTLDKPAVVNISLYSLSGNLITEIVHGKLQEGVQHITYSPKSNEMTGTYYLRLQFGNKVYVHALVKN